MSGIKGTRQTISLDTGIDLSSATDVEIHYKKPNGDTGEWSATVSGEKVTYKLDAGDIDRVGVWTFQPVVTIAGDLFKGSKAQITFDNPIKTD